MTGFPQADFTPEVERETAAIWEKVSRRITPIEWRLHAPMIAQINRIKRERNAVILAHNYMTPEIFHGVGDYVGDSLGLAREAARSDAAVIVQAGVHFMAETSKILCPDKRVLIPDLRAGCSLASSITAADAVDTEFLRPCNLCPHMKRITLENILQALVEDRYEVTVDPKVALRARTAVQRMIDLPPPAVPARYDLVRARHHVDVELI